MSTSEATILPLEKASPNLLPLVGGKAANLGELTRAGFPVPDGFCVTTAAYERVAALAQVATEIRQLDHITAEATDQLAACAASIRQRVGAVPLPSDLGSAIAAAYLQWGANVPVAVRSSATAEDLPQAAFAGQQDTFLNVVGVEALLGAVRRCWASLWTERAIAYRRRQRVDQQSVKLAVVVQHMVAAEAAGVLFTANPVTGARNEIVVDSSPGLGEAVVSGQVTPDHFVLRKGRWGWRVVERRPGRREVVIRARPEGGTEHVAASTATQLPPLPGRALHRLARLGAAIQQHFGAPQDVEWAWAHRDLFVLQARPITALPEPAPRLGRLLQMLSAMFAEMFPVRPYPLDITTWVPALSAGAVEPIFDLLGIAVPSIATFFAQEDGVVEQFSGRITPHPTPALLLAPMRVLWLALRYDPRRWPGDPLVAAARARARALEARDLGALSWRELLALMHAASALAVPLAGEPRLRYLPRAAIAAGLLRVVLGLLGRAHLFSALLSGAETRTLEANRALEALAAQVRSDPTLADLFATHAAGDLEAALAAQPAGQAFLAELRAFLDQFGHREVVLSTLRHPTWKDAPELVLGLVKGSVQSPHPPQAGQPARTVAQAEALAHPLLQLPPIRTAFLSLLQTARCFWQIREDTHFEVTRVMPILRRTLLELGRRLAAVGVLDDAETVFQLTFDELKRAGETWPPPPALAAELRAAVHRRQARRDALEGTPVVDPRLYRSLEPSGDDLLSGTPGSPGVAEGAVRVVREAADFGKLHSGEVLVAPYTNPAWTPLFQRAAAVVVDGGAASSHAAIVAREYGIPAVMGTVAGTQTLRDGERIRVDGTLGRVTRLE